MTGELIATGITYGVGRIALNNAFSGTAEFNNLILDSGANFSGGTGGGILFSGGTDLYNIFITSATSGNLWSASTGADSIIANNGSGNLAGGTNSFVAGQNNSATTTNTTVIGGNQNIASGNRSAVIGGYQNVASGEESFAGGYNSTASGKYAFAFGYNANATTYDAIALGHNIYANGYNSFVAGLRSVATGLVSMSFGRGGPSNKLTANGDFSKNFGNTDGNLGVSNIEADFAGIFTARDASIESGAVHSFIGGGLDGRVFAAGVDAAVIAGNANAVNAARSVVIGGQNITGATADTVYMPNARLAETAGSVIYSAGTDLYNIFGAGGGGSVGGTGTTNTIAKWSSSSDISDSQITDDGIIVSMYSEKFRKKTTHDYATSAGTISWDIDNSANAKIILSGNMTLNITNIESGDVGTMKVIQDSVGSHTITLGTGTHVVANGGAGTITLTSTPNAKDIITFFYDGTEFNWNVGDDYT